MVNRQYFEAKFLVDADQFERMVGKKLPQDADKLQNKLTKARYGTAFKQAGKDAEAFHNRLDKAGKKLQDTGKTLTLASAGVLAFGKVAIDAASDLNESMSKTDVVFGKAAAGVHKFAETAATSVGQSRQEAEEAANTFGNLFVSMKIGQKPAADMSVAMVRLAGDLASFNNADPSEVIEALRAGLVGETEPLRKFGINITDATQRAEVMRLGLGKIGPTLTTQQKALSSYSLILQQSKTAQGDFARTSGGLANQQRIMAAEFKDSSAALGKEFLPVALDLVSVARNDIVPVITKAADAFSSLPKPLREATVVGLALAGPLTFLGGKVVSITSFVLKSRTAWVAYRASKLAQIPADAAVAAAETQLAGATTAAGLAAESASGSIGAKGLADSTGSFVRQGIAAVPVLGALAGGFVLSLKAEKDNVSAFDELRHALGFHVDKLDNAREAQAKVTQKTAEYTQAISDQYPELDAATAKKIASTAADKDQAIQVARSAQALKDYTKALEDYNIQLDQTKSKVSGAIPVFEGFHTTGVKSSAKLREAIIKDLRQEVDGLTTWSRDTQTLLKRGADPAFILELSQKGPEYVHAMATGSNTQLHLAEKFFRDRMGAINRLSKQQLGLAGVEAPKALAAGMNSSKPKVNKAAQELRAAATEPLRRIIGFGREIGLQGGIGLAQGFGSPKVHKAVYNSVHGTVQIIEGESRRILRIESPSKAMYHVGELAGLGLAKGLESKIEHISAAGAAAGTAGAVALGKAMAAARGWTGSQWNALFQLWSHESGWRSTAQNPTSSAFGIAQFLDSTWAGTGYQKTSNPGIQIAAGLKYIASRYGNPANAWAAWQSRSPHWYGTGLPPTTFHRPTLIGVGERGPEQVTVTPLGHSGGMTADMLATAIARVLSDAYVVMDGRRVGQLVTPHVRSGIRSAQGREGIPPARQLR